MKIENLEVKFLQSIIYFDICAIAILFVGILMFYMKKNVPNLHNKVFILMMWMILGASVCNLVRGFSVNGTIDVSVDTLNMIMYIYLMFYCAIPALFLVYNFVITEQIYRAKRQIYGYVLLIPVIVMYILILINPLFNVIFKFVGKGQLKIGPGMVYVYVQSVIYFLVAVICIQIYSSLFSTYKRISLYAFVIMSLISSAIQVFAPEILVESFGRALSMVVLYLGIQSPEEMMDRELGVFNKNSFIEKAKINFKSKNRFNIIVVGIDDWEFLQKTFGVDALEELLADFVGELRIIAAENRMTVYRISENEFYILSFSMKREMRKIAETIVNKCDRVWTCGEVEIPVDVDVCIIKCPDDFENVDDILQCSDYISKEIHEGGSRILNANDINGSCIKRKNDIRHAIQKAIRNNTLQVYYQPIYSTKRKRVISAEALVRLIDDELGYIPPDEFIPIAESDGSIVRIGNFVLESVCNFMMKNNLQEKGIEFIEINVSVVECMKQDMVERIERIINKYNLNPEQINLEVTETAASNSADVMNINMQNLVERGIAFSLDDYGSGYSNINYIINLPFHLVKMDKGIVWSAFDNKKAETVLESSVSMIQKLNLKIVAEGVETKEQMDALTNMGCEFLQGYYFSKPLPEKEFLEYLDNEHKKNIPDSM